MKKWFVLAMIACVAVVVQAGDGEGKGKNEGKGKGGDVTKEQFIAQQKKMAEKKGMEFDQAKAEKKFENLDKNKDGKLSPDEKPAPKGQGKGKGEGKKPAAEE